MNYWKEMYGIRSNEFIEGVIAGITAFAIWKDGSQVVGIMERPLETEISSVKEELGYKEMSEKQMGGLT